MNVWETVGQRSEVRFNMGWKHVKRIEGDTCTGRVRMRLALWGKGHQSQRQISPRVKAYDVRRASCLSNYGISLFIH